jgi:hypothetical protein
MTQKTVYLSLTITCNGQNYTLPLTPLLLAMWLMAAFPAVEQAVSFLNKIVISTDMVVGVLVIGFLAIVMSMEVKLCYS